MREGQVRVERRVEDGLVKCYKRGCYLNYVQSIIGFQSGNT